MVDREIIEKTTGGLQREAAVRVIHRNSDGSFISESEFLAARNAEIRGEYGSGGYGLTPY